jgi:NTE family protein
VREVLDLAPGDEVTEAQVGTRVGDVFALSDFETVRYALHGHADSPALELRVKEKSWGPDIVRFDLGLYMGTDSNTAFTLAADYLRPWINDLGGEFHGAARFGRTSGIEASLYQPLDRRHRWFVEPGVTVQTSIEDIFLDGDAVARYQFSHAWGYLDAGRTFGRHTEVRAGVRSGRQQAERDIAFQELEEIPAEGYGGLSLRVTHDSRDREVLGRKGMLARVDYFRGEDELGAIGFYERLEGTVGYWLPVGENLVYLRAAGGSALDTLLPAYDTFTLGGPVSFPGLSIGELRGMSYWSAQATYLHQVAEISKLFGQSVYAGFAVTAGDMGDQIDFLSGEPIYSGSLILSGRTPLGPVSLILSYTSTDELQVVFGLGRPVEERSITDPAW